MPNCAVTRFWLALAGLLVAPLAEVLPQPIEGGIHEILSAAEAGMEHTERASDLEFLKDFVGDASIVQLGEHSHGFGDSFIVRSRITRYLCEEMGFDIVAFETPLFLSRRTDRRLAGDEPLDEVIDESLFPIWAHSKQMQPLFQWIRDRKTSMDPVEFVGVDAQLLSREGFAEEVADHLLDSIQGASDPLKLEFRQLVKELRQDSGTEYSGDWFLRASYTLSELRLLLEAPTPEIQGTSSVFDRAWALRQLHSLRLLVEGQALREIAPPFTGDFEAYNRHPAVRAGQNRRDQSMASNLAWLSQTTGRKIVFWGANSHCQECPGKLIAGKSDFPEVRHHTTGSYLTRMMGEDQVFTILHTCYQGEIAGSFVSGPSGFLWQKQAIGPAEKGSLEHRLNERGVETAIVETESLRMTGRQMRGLLRSERPRSILKYSDAVLFVNYDRASQPRKGIPLRDQDQ